MPPLTYKNLITASLLATGLLLAPAAAALEIVTGNEYAPFTDQKLPEGGFATELVKKVVESMGQTPNFRFLPWRRGFEMTAAGEALATFPYARNSEREAVTQYSDPLFTIQTKVFYHKDRPVTYTTIEDLYGKTLCNPTGYVIYDSLKEPIKAETIKLQEPSDMITCARFLGIGRSDFILTNTLSLRAVAEQAGVWGSIAAADKIFVPNYQHLIVGKKNKAAADFLPIFNEHLKKFRASEEYKALVAKHGLTDSID